MVQDADPRWAIKPGKTIPYLSQTMARGREKRSLTQLRKDMHDGPHHLDAELADWLRDLASFSSLHGLIWYTRTSSYWLQGLIFLFAVVMIIGLPTVLIVQATEFYYNAKVTTAVEWRKAPNITYPNITVCSTKYFDKQLLAERNISNDLANYLTMTLDVGVSEFAHFMTYNEPVTGKFFKDSLDRMELELDRVLYREKKTLLELFHDVAIKCDDLVVYCEVHRQFYIQDQPGRSSFKSCCDYFFTAPPFFGQAGTCYTTQVPIVETYPSIFSSVRIWLRDSQDIAPEFHMALKGSDASERNGITWALSVKDHPSQVLAVTPQRAQAGSQHMVGLEKVEIDRSGLSRDPCLDKDDSFEELFGVSSSRLNCEGVRIASLIPGCSILPYYGFKLLHELRPCMPKDMLTLDSILNQSIECPQDCRRTDFKLSITSAEIEYRSVQDFFDSTATQYGIRNDLKAKDMAVLQFYFKTFDYANNLMLQESFLDFLSKVGGWMSLAIGASIFSLLEIIYFLTTLGRVAFRHALRFRP